MTEPAACIAALRARAGPGRPRDPAKFDAIVAAARESFLERGFHASTIEDIAQRAGVSKVTLYNRFGDKETLFEQVVRTEIKQMTATFDLSAERAQTLEERLNIFGESFLAFLFHPDHVAFDRVFAQEVAQMPALAERFFAAGPLQCREKLTEVVKCAIAAGHIAAPDPARAAEDLLALWKGICDVELKLGLCTMPAQQALRARAARGTTVFLRAYAPGHERGAIV